MFKKKEEEQPKIEEKNFVLVVKYECGESAFLTNQPDLPMALKEYTDLRMKLLQDQSKSFAMPLILGAKLYRLFKEVR